MDIDSTMTLVFDGTGVLDTSDSTMLKFQILESEIQRAVLSTASTVNILFAFSKSTRMSQAVERRIRKIQTRCAELSGFGGRNFRASGHLIIGLSGDEYLGDYQPLLSLLSFCLNEGVVQCLTQKDTAETVKEYLDCDRYANNWLLVYNIDESTKHSDNNPLKSRLPEWMVEIKLPTSHDVLMTFGNEFLSLTQKEKEELCLIKINATQLWVKKLTVYISKMWSKTK